MICKKYSFISEGGTDYEALYQAVNDIIGNATPLGKDCGVLCGAACCKGGDRDGMILFPHEATPFNTYPADGYTLAVCDGKCNREERPLACRIFPFFPTVADSGKIYVEIDTRAKRLCPIAANCDMVKFDRKFIKAIKKAGQLLSLDSECLEFMRRITEEIDYIEKFYE